jgi:hypothetical protein
MCRDFTEAIRTVPDCAEQTTRDTPLLMPMDGR